MTPPDVARAKAWLDKRLTAYEQPLRAHLEVLLAEYAAALVDEERAKWEASAGEVAPRRLRRRPRGF